MWRVIPADSVGFKDWVECVVRSRRQEELGVGKQGVSASISVWKSLKECGVQESWFSVLFSPRTLKFPSSPEMGNEPLGLEKVQQVGTW